MRYFSIETQETQIVISRASIQSIIIFVHVFKKTYLLWYIKILIVVPLEEGWRLRVTGAFTLDILILFNFFSLIIFSLYIFKHF